MDLALNNLQRLICHKTQTTNEQAIPHKYIGHCCEVGEYADEVTTSSGLPSSRRWRVLFFVKLL